MKWYDLVKSSSLMSMVVLLLGYTTMVSANNRDSLALVALYQSLDGPNWNQNWDFDEPIEFWHGVQTNVNGDVVWLDLSNNRLKGVLPEEIGFLSELQVLKLPFNEITGALPNSIGILVKLRELTIFNNQLNQPLPDTIVNLTRLTQLSLSNNQITGTLPKRLGKMSALQMLILDRNQFTGGVPESIGQCSELVFLSLHDNLLDGTLPTSMGQLSKLKECLIFNNQLRGEIPATFQEMDSLMFFWAHDNRFEGQLPPFKQSSLLSIRVERNQLSGLPDLNGLKLGQGFPEGLSVEENLLSFDDIIINLGLKDSIRFSYTPQDTLPLVDILYANQGDRLQYILPFDDTVSTSAYRWFLDGDLNQLTNENALIINNLQPADEGRYHAEIRNNLVQDLVLVTSELDLVVRDSLSCDVPPAGEICFRAPVFCKTDELDLYCGSLPFAPDTMPCVSRDLTPETRWLAWIADSSVQSLEILPYSCSALDAGIQWSVYQGCAGRQLVYCQDECTSAETTAELTDLLPGETYLLAIRSCGGNCKYQIRIDGGDEEVATRVGSGFNVPDTVCSVIDPVVIEINDSPLGIDEYIWTVDGDTSETLVPEYTFVPMQQGEYEYCVYGITECDTTETLCQNLTVFPGLGIEDVLIDVVRNDSFYIVQFEINGGLGNVVIDSIEGTYNAVTQVFVSDLIPCGQRYSAVVTDATGCSDYIKGVEVCRCDSDAGRLPNDLSAGCIDELIRVGPASRVTLDTNDASVYTLLPTQTFRRNDVLIQEASPVFTFDGNILESNRVYYAFHVVGNAQGQQVDLTDPCLSVSGPQPVVFYDFPSSDAGDDQRVCQNQFTLRAGVLNSGASGYWQQLSGPGGVMIQDSTERVTAVTVSTEGVYQFTWNVDRNGCDARDTVMVEVLPEIQAQIVGPDSLCVGQIDTLRLNRTFDSYSWQNGDTTAYTLINEPGQYCVEVVLNGLCSKRICKIVQDAVLNAPNIMGDLFICGGETTQLQVIPQYDEYTWSTGDDRFFIEVDSPGTYCITVTDFGGCQAMDCVVVVQDDSRTTSLSDTFCYGDTLSILDTFITSTGSYVISRDDGQDCDTTIQVDVLFYDEIYISDSLIVRDDGSGSGSISVNIKGGQPPYKYLWSTGAQIPFISGLSAEIYTLTVTDANGCEQVFEFDLRVPNSVFGTSNRPSDIRILPNPVFSSEGVSVQYTGSRADLRKVLVSIHSIDGKEWAHKTVDLSFRNSGQLSIDELEEGVYLLYISDPVGNPLGMTQLVVQP